MVHTVPSEVVGGGARRLPALTPHPRRRLLSPRKEGGAVAWTRTWWVRSVVMLLTPHPGPTAVELRPEHPEGWTPNTPKSVWCPPFRVFPTTGPIANLTAVHPGPLPEGECLWNAHSLDARFAPQDLRVAKDFVSPVHKSSAAYRAIESGAMGVFSARRILVRDKIKP